MRKLTIPCVALLAVALLASPALAQSPLKVAVFDENPRPGGQIYRQAPHDFKRTDGRALGIKNRNKNRRLQTRGSPRLVPMAHIRILRHYVYTPGGLLVYSLLTG